jgi:hypothetical protein
MTLAFDTLGYAKRLRDKGIAQEQAEAHAEAARDFIMAELATKTDLLTLKQSLEAAIEHSTLRVTVRFGAILVVAVGALAASLRL